MNRYVNSSCWCGDEMAAILKLPHQSHRSAGLREQDLAFTAGGRREASDARTTGRRMEKLLGLPDAQHKTNSQLVAS